ncbi:hypothetical protein [Miltoncostaea oceani]|uniref:hypothetical protein n=1 Tax=Miltoncostaea oceani TaxID=2843216 RepID=UPI001C3CAE74|nr:hypothetical protein [Miltoncostaea oceani]
MVLLVLLAMSAAALAPRAGAVQGVSYPYYTYNARCTGVLVALNEPGVGSSGGGYLRTVTQSLNYSAPGNNPCYLTLNVATNQIRTNQVLQKLSGGSWSYCASTQTGDYYNTSPDWTKTISTNYGASPRCGGGTYRGVGRGWVSGSGGATATPGIGL